MKRIIIIITIFLFTSGCYNYNELNDLAIVSGIGIDYENNNFILTMEVLKNEKVSSETSTTSNKSYLLKAKGKTLKDATNRIANASDKSLFFAHTEVLIIGEEFASSGISEIFDYIIRNPNTRNELYTLVAKDTTAENILSLKSKSFPINSQKLMDMLDNNQTEANWAITTDFDTFMANQMKNNFNEYLSSVEIKNEELEISKIALFNNFKLKKYLTFKEAHTYLLLNEEIKELISTFKCNDNYDVISFFDKKLKKKINKDKVTFNLVLYAKIDESNCKYRVTNNKEYLKLENIYEHIVKKEINYNLEKSQNDLYNINKLYYQKYPQLLKKNTYQLLDYEVNVKVNIVKRGLIFNGKDAYE